MRWDPIGIEISLSNDYKLNRKFVGKAHGFRHTHTPRYLFRIFLTITKSYDYFSETFQVFREVKVKGFDASQYEAKQIFYSSKDGTKVPMFIVSKKVS